MNWVSRLKIMSLIAVSLSSANGARAQDIDYLKHGKYFDLCAYKLECSNCNTCGKQRYQVKLNNKGPQAIKAITYSFYSEVFNKVLTKPATIKADRINAKEIGYTYLCLPEGKHWAITGIEYKDGTKVNFVVRERMDNFIQEPDECDCND